MSRAPLSSKPIRSQSVSSVRSTESNPTSSSEPAELDRMRRSLALLKHQQLRKRQRKAFERQDALRDKASVLQHLTAEVAKVQREARRRAMVAQEYEARGVIRDSVQDLAALARLVINYFSVIPLKGVAEAEVTKVQEALQEFERKHPPNSADWLAVREALHELSQLDPSGPPISSICTTENFSKVSQLLRDMDSINADIALLLDTRDKLHRALHKARAYV